VPYRPALALAGRLGLVVAEFPGDHVGFLAHPADFAERLADVLGRARPPA
jgi:hypothetical protein